MCPGREYTWMRFRRFHRGGRSKLKPSSSPSCRSSCEMKVRRLASRLGNEDAATARFLGQLEHQNRAVRGTAESTAGSQTGSKGATNRQGPPKRAKYAAGTHNAPIMLAEVKVRLGLHGWAWLWLQVPTLENIGGQQGNCSIEYGGKGKTCWSLSGKLPVKDRSRRFLTTQPWHCLGNKPPQAPIQLGSAGSLNLI